MTTSTTTTSTTTTSTTTTSTPTTSTPAASTPTASTPTASTPTASTPTASTPTASTPTASTPARPATAADSAALVTLRSVLLRSMQLDADDPGWQDGYLARLADPDVFTAVAEREGQVVASAVALLQRRLPTPGTPSGTYGWLEQVATLPEARGEGSARACVLACLDWLRAQGVTEVQMQSTEAGEPLYRDLGFEDDPQARLVLRLEPRSG